MDSSSPTHKIALLIGSLSGGGAERVTCNLANYLHQNGYAVDVITLSNKNDTYKLDKGVNRVCLLDESERANKVHNLIVKLKRLKQYVLKNQDISCYVTMLPISAFMLTRLKKHINCKIIISDRNDPACYGYASRFMMNYAVKRCDGLVVQTKEISKWYKNIKNKKIIPNAINQDVQLPKRNNIEEKFVAVGRLRKQKNYPMMLTAFKIFNTKHPNYILEIYGQGGEEARLKKIVNEYGLNDKIKFMGYVKNISERISNATGFVMTSNYEGMSNALIEAMCIGLPCVVTDCGGGSARDLVENMENGILIKKGAVNEMVAGMNKIVEDKAFSQKISNNAKKLRNKLDPQKIYGEWMDFIKKEIG